MVPSSSPWLRTLRDPPKRDSEPPSRLPDPLPSSEFYKK